MYRVIFKKFDNNGNFVSQIVSKCRSSKTEAIERLERNGFTPAFGTRKYPSTFIKFGGFVATIVNEKNII
jgi:hypothetical protein